MISIFDSPDPVAVAAKASTLFDDGVRGVLLYISPDYLAGAKTVRKAQADAIRAAGIAVGFICETWGGSDNFSHNDITAASGTRHGGVCSHYMKAVLGAPPGVAIHPTIDDDVNAQQLARLCLPYFGAFRDNLSTDYKLGAYGCGALLFGLETESDAAEPPLTSIVDVPWLSNAMGWSRSREYLATGRATIVQQPQTSLLGIDIDPDIVKGDLAAAGFWMPTAVAAVPSGPVVAASPAVQTNIIATCFGGAGDSESSAYGGMVNPAVPGVALPFHFTGIRPKVKVTRGAASVVCEIVDVGPHNTNDPYWIKSTRPLAESQIGNKAGIDMTPAGWAELGIATTDPAYGLTAVDWEFAS